jgi:DNA-binding NarL/FixJ family response regulator
MPITVAIVEDDPGTLKSLLALLGGGTMQDTVRCVSTHANGAAAIRDMPAAKPDVALVDINLPGMNGIECVAKLRTLLPDLHVLMLTAYEDSDLIFKSLRAGAKGYLLKKNVPTELIAGIEQVFAGGAPMSMQVARKVVDHFQRAEQTAAEVEQLTTREQEVLALLAKGHLNKEISDQLGISFATVRAHLRNIYEKLHVQSRTEAAAKFLRQK